MNFSRFHQELWNSITIRHDSHNDNGNNVVNALDSIVIESSFF